MRALGWVGTLLVALALAVATAPGIHAGIGVQPGTHDYGVLARGEAGMTQVVIRNGGVDTIAVETRGENLEGATLTAAPATFTLASGASRTLDVRVTVPNDAAPGRHTPVLVASARADGPGNQAIGAVQVQLQYRVEVVDVAFATALANDTVFLRVVNGHEVARDITLTATMWNGTTSVENVTYATTLAGGANALRYWALGGTYREGPYLLVLEGTATGGASPEAFGATFVLTRSNGTFQTMSSPSSSTGGGGGGGAPDPTAGPTPGGGGGGGPVLTYPVPEHQDPEHGEASRPVGGGQPEPHPVAPVRVLPRGLETLLDSVTYSLVAAAVALAAGAAVFVGRGRLFH